MHFTKLNPTNIKIRKQQLLKAVKDNKLDYKWYGESYSFVMYGKPSLEQVVKNEIIKMQDKTKRKIKLAKHLSKRNLELDESLPSCYNYINCVGCKGLTETVRDTEIESFFKKYTNCDELMNNEKLSLFEARELSLKNFLNSKNSDSISVPDNIINKSIYVVFD